MMENSSDTDDDDFVVNLEDRSSDSSIQSDNISSESDDNDENPHKNKKIKKARHRKKNVGVCSKGKKSLPGISQSDTCHTDQIKANDEKTKSDSLWTSFLNDTATTSKSEVHGIANNSSNEGIHNSPSNIKTSSNLKLPVSSSSRKIPQNCSKKEKPGISNLLKNVSKRSKLSVLEKSKLEWNKYKDENNLKEELSNFNRGKNGYLEKQDFLCRTDSRQFEIEKVLRNAEKRRLQ